MRIGGGAIAMRRDPGDSGATLQHAEEHQFCIGGHLGGRGPGEPTLDIEHRKQLFELQQHTGSTRFGEPFRIGADRVGAVERLAGEGRDEVHRRPAAARSARIAAGNSSSSG